MILWYFLLLQVSVFCLTAGEIEAQKSGWNLAPNTQYHIQTDEGPERYFRYQTLNGQYRKEKRLADGTVVGTEGWLDPLGYLRIKDYIADGQGYRILRSKMVYVGKDRPIQDAVSISKKVPAQSGILAKPQRPVNPFRRPEIKELPGNSIEVNTVRPLLSTVSAPVHPHVQYQVPISTSTPSPPSTLYSSTIGVSSTPPYRERVQLNQLEDGYSQPNTNYLPSYQFQRPYSSTPYQNPYQNPYYLPQAQSQPSVSFQPPLSYGERYPQSNQPQVQSHSSTFYRAPIIKSQASYDTAASHVYPSSQNYYSSNHNSTQQGNQIGRIVQSAAGDKTVVSPVVQRVGEFPEYDGTHTVKDGFQYYLKTHYHEEEKKPDDDEKIGSFGYIDPFGIRRVIYYKADAEHGFIHKKNNRYVGFQATPYDPQLSDRS